MVERTKDKFLFHDTIISWACIIWAIASIGLMIHFTGLNQVTFAMMTFGQLFIIMGIIAICRRQATGLIFITIGLGCIVIPAINEWGGMFNPNFKSNNIFPLLFSTAMAVVGFAMMLGPRIIEKSSFRRCKETVEAECVDYIEAKLSDDAIAYAPIYMYQYNDKDYVKCREKYTKGEVPTVGEKTTLKINPNNPEDVYFEATKASKMLIYIFGFSFFVAGIGMLITTIGSIR